MAVTTQTEIASKTEQILKAVDLHMKSGADRQEQINKLQLQIDALDLSFRAGHMGGSVSTKSLEGVLKENESFTRLAHDKKGRAVITLTGSDAALLERKTVNTLTSSGTGFGLSTSGVLPIERTAGIVPEARQAITVMDVLSSRPTINQVIDFVRVSSPMSIASPVAEASLKPQTDVQFSTASARVITLAVWTLASKQLLEDMADLAGYINTTLAYQVDRATELQVLYGSGTGEDLNGLITQASAFNTGLLHPTQGFSKIDIIGRAQQQISATNEAPPTFVVLHPNDWWDLRLTRDGFGRFILGDPQDGAMAVTRNGALVPTQNIFGLRVIPTTNIQAGHFLVGSGSPAASEIRQRMETVIDVSTEDSDNFRRNLISLRAECRLALVVYRPASYITGTLTTSPA